MLTTAYRYESSVATFNFRPMKKYRILRPRHIYQTILLIVWLTLCGLLFKTNYITSSRARVIASLATGIKNIPSDSEWMNIYHNGKKLGYTLSAITNLGSEGYAITSTTRMRPVIAGVTAEVSLSNRVRVDTLFRLISFDFRLLSEQLNTRMVGQRQGGTLLLTIHQGKETTTREIALPDDVYSTLGLQAMVARQGIKPGDHLKIPSFDPMAMEMGEMEIIHEGKETIVIDGTSYNLNKIRVEFRGFPSLFWLDDNGLTYREQSVLGLVMERTTPAAALAFDDQAPDLIETYAIPVDQPILRQEDLTELELELIGIDSSLVLAGLSERQQLISGSPVVLRMRAVPTTADEPLAPYLVATPLIQSSHPQIVSTARTVTRESTDPEKRAEALVNFVFNYIKKQPVVSVGAAVDILDGKAGDCSEHTTLYTALSRSLGLPTKMNIGIVYLQGRFLYHAWPSVYLNGQWVAVDPTLGQVRADPTHITFMEGDFSRIAQLVPVLGKLQIHILQQTHKTPS
ncbi:MAG: transglutaminase family protein [Fidelibacterota bacterium]